MNVSFPCRLNEHLVRVMVISATLPGCVESAPKSFTPRAALYGGDGVVPVILEFERDVMDPQLGTFRMLTT
jgi:hypothetical protein